jgi:hypothetical protein
MARHPALAAGRVAVVAGAASGIGLAAARGHTIHDLPKVVTLKQLFLRCYRAKLVLVSKTDLAN